MEKIEVKHWQQVEKQIQLAFEIEGLSEIPNSCIKLKVAKSSLNLTISIPDSGRELNFRVEKLFKKIVPADTNSLRKDNVLTIVLTKRDDVYWP